MRASHLATALTAFTAGLSAAAALQRLAGRREPATAPEATAAPEVATPETAAPAGNGVVLPFVRSVPTPPAPSAAGPARCGDSGELTRSGAPCGARATGGGRCHHHPLAA
ncbi:hypothetical protein [Blastococcus sp. SYSU D00695]